MPNAASAALPSACLVLGQVFVALKPLHRLLRQVAIWLHRGGERGRPGCEPLPAGLPQPGPLASRGSAGTAWQLRQTSRSTDRLTMGCRTSTAFLPCRCSSLMTYRDSWLLPQPVRTAQTATTGLVEGSMVRAGATRPKSAPAVCVRRAEGGSARHTGGRHRGTRRHDASQQAASSAQLSRLPVLTRQAPPRQLHHRGVRQVRVGEEAARDALLPDHALQLLLGPDGQALRVEATCLFGGAQRVTGSRQCVDGAAAEEGHVRCARAAVEWRLPHPPAQAGIAAHLCWGSGPL